MRLHWRRINGLGREKSPLDSLASSTEFPVKVREGTLTDASTRNEINQIAIPAAAGSNWFVGDGTTRTEVVMTEIESRITEYIRDRQHMGVMQDPTAVGRSSLDGQPPITSLGLRIDQGVVVDGRFQTSGCGYLIASCAAAIELSIGQRAEACLAIQPADVVAHLGGLPEHRLFAADLAIEALHNALIAATENTVSEPLE